MPAAVGILKIMTVRVPRDGLRIPINWYIGAIKAFQRVTAFLAGQVIIQLLIVVVGILFARILPVDQFALYTAAGSLLALMSIASNPGIGQAVVSLGATKRNNANFLGSLFNAARRYSYCLSVAGVFITSAVATYIFLYQTSYMQTQVLWVVLAVITIGLVQIDTTLSKAILYLEHDARSIFQIGVAESAIRIGLVSICIVWPLATAALFVNLAGALGARIVALRHAKKLLDPTAEPTEENRVALRRFVIPIAPLSAYSLVHGQLAIFLLSANNLTRAIAEFGALSRLAQAFGMLMMLGPFFIQPVFARITELRVFQQKLLVLSISLALFCFAVLATVYALPHLWLLPLGANYSGLIRELPLAIGCALASLVGTMLYLIVIARAYTRSQTFGLLLCFAGQIAYVLAYGIETTSDAFILTLIPGIIFMVFQGVQLRIILRQWDDKSKKAALPQQSAVTPITAASSDSKC